MVLTLKPFYLHFFYRQMPELIEHGYVYIAQPPLYKVKKGKKEEYIKDEKEMFEYLMRQASGEVKVETALGPISGQTLRKALSETVDLKNYMERFTRRLSGDSKLAQTIVRAFAGKNGVLDKHKAKIKEVFDKEELMAEVEKIISQAGYKTDLTVDEEHGLSEIEILTDTGRVIFDWEKASYVEFQKAIELETSLEKSLPAPYTLSENGKKEVINERELLLEKILEIAKRDLVIQRYKGLGEMNPEQLWETTMNPEKRVLLQVRIEDAIETDELFTVLMGDAVEPRRKFIEENALEVKNLDV